VNLWLRLQCHLDAHAHELSGKVSEDIWKCNLINCRRRLTGSALNLPHARQCSRGMGRDRRSNASTLCADIAERVVRTVHQTILKQVRHSVSQKRITLHLSETNTSSTLTTLDRLHRKVVHWSSRTHLVLVSNHVTKTLVVNDLLKCNIDAIVR